MLRWFLQLVGINPSGDCPGAEVILNSELAAQARYEDYKSRAREGLDVSRNLTADQARRLLPSFGWWPEEVSSASNAELIEAARLSLRWEAGDASHIPSWEKLDKIKALIKA
jgi:hypothetical protein